MLQDTLTALRTARLYPHLPSTARAELHRDIRGLRDELPGAIDTVRACAAWLCAAQDGSATKDGGVARDFGLRTGWASSYPETTGYIIPTMLELADRFHDDSYRQRAKRMLDWLARIQLPSGGFQGGKIDQIPVVPVTFNTGQILIGLAAGVKAFGNEYRTAMVRAADWLASSLDADGCWRRHPTPFAESGEKAYETHVAWGLFEAHHVSPGRGYLEAGLRQVRWALSHQRANGWVDKCCLAEPERPLTHTLGYFLRGVIEAYRSTADVRYLAAARRTAEGLLRAQRADGALPGRLDAHWHPAVRYSCLTGNAQVAHCWIMMFEFTGESSYLDAATRANRFVRRTVRLNGPDGVRGGVKGSFPVWGEYNPFEYLNWAGKFFIDSQLAELDVTGGSDASRVA